MNLSIASKTRTAEAMLQLAASRFLMKFVKLKIWRKALGRQGLAPADQIERGIKYARHVNHAARHLPFEVLCLPLAMALSFMLRRRSIPHAIHPEKAPRNCLVALRTSFERTGGSARSNKLATCHPLPCSIPSGRAVPAASDRANCASSRFGPSSQCQVKTNITLDPRSVQLLLAGHQRQSVLLAFRNRAIIKCAG